MNYKFAIQEPLSLRLYSPVQPKGFRLRTLSHIGSCLPNLSRDYNHLVYCAEGKASISCNEFINRPLKAGELTFVPIAADFLCQAVTPNRMITFTFEKFFDLSERSFVHDVSERTSSLAYNYEPLTASEPLMKFFESLESYLKGGMSRPILHDIKHSELVLLLKASYSNEELASLFYPIAGKSIDFRIEVLRNYRKVAHVEGLTNIFHNEKRTFGRQFKEEFNMSPYQWLLSQKAKHVLFSLCASNQSLDVIRKEHGFKFPGHFTRFCREQFNTTPTALMSKYRRPSTTP